MPTTYAELMQRVKEIDISPIVKPKPSISLPQIVANLLAKRELHIADYLKLLLRYMKNRNSLGKDTLETLENFDVPKRIAMSFYNQYPEHYSHFLAPVKIYVNDDDVEKFNAVRDAVFNLARLNDIYVDFPGPQIKGSIFQSFLGVFDVFSKKVKLNERLEKIEIALETQHIDKPRAEIDRDLAEAVSKLITALSSVDEGALSLGSVVLIKLKNKGKSQIVSFNMTNAQMELLNKNPDLLKNPSSLLKLMKPQAQSSVQRPALLKEVVQLEVGRL